MTKALPDNRTRTERCIKRHYTRDPAIHLTSSQTSSSGGRFLLGLKPDWRQICLYVYMCTEAIHTQTLARCNIWAVLAARDPGREQPPLVLLVKVTATCNKCLE